MRWSSISTVLVQTAPTLLICTCLGKLTVAGPRALRNDVNAQPLQCFKFACWYWQLLHHEQAHDVSCYPATTPPRPPLVSLFAISKRYKSAFSPPPLHPSGQPVRHQLQTPAVLAPCPPHPPLPRFESLSTTNKREKLACASPPLLTMSKHETQDVFFRFENYKHSFDFSERVEIVSALISCPDQSLTQTQQKR